MIVYLNVEPGVAQIYQAQAVKLDTTMRELMESVLAFWPAVQWTEQPPSQPAETPSQTEPGIETTSPVQPEAPFGAGY
jgi:hypothetical protein